LRAARAFERPLGRERARFRKGKTSHARQVSLERAASTQAGFASEPAKTESALGAGIEGTRPERLSPRAACPEWSVVSEAEGEIGERDVPWENTSQIIHSDRTHHTPGGSKGRVCSGNPVNGRMRVNGSSLDERSESSRDPDPSSTERARRADAVAGAEHGRAFRMSFLSPQPRPQNHNRSGVSISRRASLSISGDARHSRTLNRGTLRSIYSRDFSSIEIRLSVTSSKDLSNEIIGS